MYINIIKSYRKVVAICDSEILGKKFEQENKQLDIKESFYKGETGKKVEEQELIDLIEKNRLEDATFNIVGEKSIQTCIKAGLIDKSSIATIANIPYSLVLI